jgi:hypothetical protein
MLEEIVVTARRREENLAGAAVVDPGHHG